MWNTVSSPPRRRLLNDEIYIDRKGIPERQGEDPFYLFNFHFLKLEIVLAIPALNDEIYIDRKVFQGDRGNTLPIYLFVII